jgi:hypothetical protein
MRTVVLQAALIALLAAPLAHAQSPGQLLPDLDQVLFRGERVRIVDANRSTIEGRFDGVSDSSLRLIASGTRRDIAEAQIHQVYRMRFEPDGLLLGVGLGIAAGMTYVAIHCRGAGEHADCINTGSVILIPPAAVIGAIVDWRIRHFDTIFQRTASPAVRLQIVPLLSRQQNGVVVGLVF